MSYIIDNSVQLNGTISDVISISNNVIYATKEELNNGLAAKQNILDASTNILGIGSEITSLNYNNISNPPNLSVYLTSSSASSTYATISQLNTKQNILYFMPPLNNFGNTVTISLSNYLTTSSASSTYATISQLNTKQNLISFLNVDTPNTTLDVSGNITAKGLSIADTNILSSLLVRKLNFVGKDAVMRIFRCNDGNNAPAVELIWRSTLPSSGSDYTYYWDMYVEPTLAGLFCIRDRTVEQIRLSINSSGNVGIGKTPTSYKLDVNGGINGTNLYINGTNISSVYLSVVAASFEYYTKSYIDTSFNNVYTKSYIDTSFNNVYTKSYIDTSLNNVYTKSYIDTSLNNVYTKSYIDTSFNDVYTKSYIDTSFNDVYTKSYIDTSFNDVYTKSYIDTSFNNVYTKSYIDTSFNNLTNLTGDWNTLINKPTNFQADWNSTIINKPTNFQADWNSTIINKPTNFQSDWNSTIINKPTIINSQWVSSGANIYYNTGNVSIGTATANGKLNIVGGDVYMSGVNLNIVDTNIPTSVMTRQLNLIGTDACMRLFRCNTANAPSIDFRYKSTTPTSDTDSTYWWDIYMGTTARFISIRDRTSGSVDRLVIADTHNYFRGSTNRYTWFNDEIADDNGFNHTTCPVTIFHKTRTSSTVLNDPQPILHLSREGTSAQAYGARATFKICRFENSSTNSRTRLDIDLSHTTYNDVNVMTIRSDGRVGINRTAPGSALDVNGTVTATSISVSSINLNSGNLTNGATITATTFSGSLSGNATSATTSYRLNPYVNEWLNSTDGKNRFYFGNNDRTYFGSQNGYEWRNSSDGYIASINNDGTFYYKGRMNIHNGNNSAVPNNYMANGSLTIGDTNTNYGGNSTWGSSTAGLMMECLDNTEIIVHDSGHRLTSLLYYQGGASFNNIYIGRDCGWGLPNYIIMNSTLSLFGEWYISKGQPSGIDTVNSLIFSHIKSGFNSRWWFNGTQTSTTADISDERIKKEIKDIDNPIEKIMKIKPKEYYLCEDKDYNKKYGVIAQDINQEEELKHLIYKDTDYIANIYSNAFVLEYCEASETTKIRIEKDITGLINIDDELKILLDNKENKEFIIDDTPFNNRYKKRFVKVKSIIDENTIEIYDKVNVEDIDKNKLFIYGKKTNEFLKLDYQSLYCLNLKVTQELIKKVELLEERINQLTINQN